MEDNIATMLFTTYGTNTNLQRRISKHAATPNY